MRSAEEILTDLVAAEEAGLRHHEGCGDCQQRGKCPQGIRLAMESIELTMEAKLWVDTRQSHGQVTSDPERRTGLSVVR